MGRGQGPDAVLDLPDIRVDRQKREGDEARHMREPGGDQRSRRDVPGRCHPVCREPDRAPDHHHRQSSRQRHQKRPEKRRKPAKPDCAVPVLRKRAERLLVLVIGVGEELHGRDVGDRIHDLPGHHRPRVCPFLRLCLDARQEVHDQERVDDQPDQKARDKPRVDEGHHHDRRDEGGKREAEDVQPLHDHIHDRAGRLLLLLCDPSGEVVVKEGQRLAKGEPVQPPERERIEVCLHR